MRSKSESYVTSATRDGTLAPEAFVNDPLLLHGRVELRRVGVRPRGPASDPLSPAPEADGPGQQIEDGGVHALASRLGERLQASCELRRGVTDRELTHDSRIPPRCCHAAKP